MSTPIVDPLVGRTVLQYEILARIGGGGMGVVYRARDGKLGRTVALKFLPQQWSHDESAKERFVREAQAASATHHPNICTIHDIETADDGQLFIVMAHYDGETLKRRLENGRLPVDEALDIATQVADGLAKAHAQGVIHRDVKPGNLMLTEDGVRILDFGLAKFADSLQITTVNSTLGTAAYMSPEQVRGEEADARSDVWAVGVMLYEMLTGRVPFRGGYAEAVGYAIRNETPAPIRAERPEIPEEVEQLVFRALHKDPAIRFKSGRELARALRVVRGLSVPVELPTEPVPAPATPHTAPRTGRRWPVAAAILVLALGGAAVWLLSPPVTTKVAVVPVANRTGYAELEPYRLGLTHSLVEHLRGSRDVRVMPYAQLLQILRRYADASEDVSSREVVRTIAGQSDAQVIVVPTLMYQNGWQVRIEFVDPATATTSATVETSPIASTLHKETALGLMTTVSNEVVERLQSRRSRLFETLRTYVRGTRTEALASARTLDAVQAFEAGIRAYEDQRLAAARDAFVAASRHDPRNPLFPSWASRVSRLMRLDKEALQSADDAVKLVTDGTPHADRLFVEAVAAEARREYPTAQERYEALANLRSDDVAWMMELAAFRDRRNQNTEAITAYHDVLRINGNLARPHVELCRVYTRINDLAKAREHVDQALRAYRALGARGGEGQALLCLSDVIRLRGGDALEEARYSAEAALEIFDSVGDTYNLSRAYNYVGLIAGTAGRRSDAAAQWEKALDLARAVGNVALQPRILTNLGVTHAALGDQARALAYYQQSYTLNEELGDEQEAARGLANAATIVIDYGIDPDPGLRNAETALAMFESLGDRTFEVVCLQARATYLRNRGRYADAERELNRARAVAQQHNLGNRGASVVVDLARVRIELNDYAAARQLLQTAIDSGSDEMRLEGRIHMGRVLARVGDFAGARRELELAAGALTVGGDERLAPLLQLAVGEAAYLNGELERARVAFAAADRTLSDQLVDPASAEARAYLGLLDAVRGGRDSVRTLRSVVERARSTSRLALEVRARVFLARSYLARNDVAEAFRTLTDIPDGAADAIGPELRAQVHAVRGDVLGRRGDAAGARREAAAARGILQDIQRSLPEEYRDRFVARYDIRAMST